MSAFLGPIHLWLYNKIQVQERIVQHLLAYSKQNQLEQQLDQYGIISSEPLEDIIDGTNIHAWLQERISVVEMRLAHAVTEILKNDSLQNLKVLFNEIGKEFAPTKDDVAILANLFEHFNNTLLDGMPCDRVNQLVSKNDNEVVWRRNLCVHTPYWDRVGGDISVYYSLREAFIEGMLAETEIGFEKVDDVTSKVVRR